MEESVRGAAQEVPPFVDANILLRYLTGDPLDLALRARRLLEGTVSLSVSTSTIAETAHVLRSFYRVSREEIVDALIALVERDTIVPHGMDRATLVEALSMCRPSGRITIPDALLWAEARSSGAGVVYTFDQQFPSFGIEVRS